MLRPYEREAVKLLPRFWILCNFCDSFPDRAFCVPYHDEIVDGTSCVRRMSFGIWEDNGVLVLREDEAEFFEPAGWKFMDFMQESWIAAPNQLMQWGCTRAITSKAHVHTVMFGTL